jgi:hypothetical protein
MDATSDPAASWSDLVTGPGLKRAPLLELQARFVRLLAMLGLGLGLGKR